MRGQSRVRSTWGAALVASLALSCSRTGRNSDETAAPANVPGEAQLPSKCDASGSSLSETLDRIVGWVAAGDDNRALGCKNYVDSLDARGLELLAYPDLILALDRSGRPRLAIDSTERLRATLAGERGFDKALPVTLKDAADRLTVGVLGEAVVLATGVVENGKFADKTDAEIVARIRRGSIGRDALVGLARRKAASSSAQRFYYSHKRSMNRRMEAAVGAEGLARELYTVMKGYGHASSKGLRIALSHWNLSHQQVEDVAWVVEQMPTEGDHVLLARPCTVEAITLRLHEIASGMKTADARGAVDKLLERLDAAVAVQ